MLELGPWFNCQLSTCSTSLSPTCDKLLSHSESTTLLVETRFHESYQKKDKTRKRGLQSIPDLLYVMHTATNMNGNKNIYKHKRIIKRYLITSFQSSWVYQNMKLNSEVSFVYHIFILLSSLKIKYELPLFCSSVQSRLLTVAPFTTTTQCHWYEPVKLKKKILFFYFLTRIYILKNSKVCTKLWDLLKSEYLGGNNWKLYQIWFTSMKNNHGKAMIYKLKPMATLKC